MTICPKTNEHCFYPECGKTTGICAPPLLFTEQVAILKESKGEQENTLHKKLLSEANNFQAISQHEFAGGLRYAARLIEIFFASDSSSKIKKPKVVCFCGSTRFAEWFMIERWELEKKGIITLGINILPDGYFVGENHHGAEQEGVKHILDELHLRKIDLADEVVILNVGGYIGESTQRELDYAISIGKPVNYLEK